MAFIDKITVASTTNDATRYIGGANRSELNDHPYTKGYFYVFFGLPTTIFSQENGIDTATARQYLLVSAEDFTPPGDRQLNMQDIQGQGGIDASFIVGQTISRDFSLQYRDYWGAPIFRIHRLWTSYMNPYLGGSFIAQDFTANEYKGVCMVIQTKPVVRNLKSGNTGSSINIAAWTSNDIIKVDYFDGVCPTTDLKSVYSSSITDNSFVKPTVQYKFDGMPLDETNLDVLNTAVTVLNSTNVFDNTAALYNTLAKTDPTQINL